MTRFVPGWRGKPPLGVLLMALGALLVPAMLLVPIAFAPNEEVVFVAPGRASLDVVRPGRFCLWHEYRAWFEGERIVGDGDLPRGLSIELRRAESGRSIPLRTRSGITIESGDSASHSVAIAEIRQPGAVDIVVAGGDGRRRVFSFSRFEAGSWLRALSLGALSLLLIGGSGLILAIVGVAQRVQRRA